MNAPERGQLTWVSFDPSLGHEQGGRRPALVVSNTRYNERTGLMICMPVTSRAKGYTSEIALPETLITRGVVLASHIYTLDWQARDVQAIEDVPPEVLAAALQRLAVILLQ
ncbi:mRNA-degrading endonuclease [Deinococcus metallilatus]|uniref:mRNA interferase MazF n=1 Tax=Deinococcus metallilatus TaxID=1211322 RepID=A0AAJ5F6Q5_9DEIO|nr:type II toxin-antitoxin system PemK/MazF family toxin [Deinococcus metallilatus]MBB5295522.1 mRNA interferase MazF [Deinococcus metallilatus]QBY07964.1 mRNA-degrading endonuclease [Deinococcus metallilatus]RXJ12857.1 mRNA-degrading endonuclease [Deinococcus metallilatus]TLK27221.1 mRNA-degrading endonuclease [Deinococcus metallilatus]GMA16200.1 mRNA-degrading endonuclease [Deinococcus metallilatus]